MPDINQFPPSSGRKIKENGQMVNQAEMIEALYNALVVNKNAGVQLSGSNVAPQVDILDHMLTNDKAIPVKRAYKRIVLSMQGQSIAAGATLTQDIDLSGFDKAVFAAVFSSSTFTGSATLINLIGALWVAPTTGNVATATNNATTPVFTPIAERQRVSLTNTSAGALTITTAEVIAQ